MNRRKLAVEWSAKSFVEQKGRTYFWTFTTVRETTPEELLGMWDVLLKRIRRLYAGVQFFRVLEPHASGRRFHLHVLLNVRLHVQWVRQASSPLGFGRVHVARVRDTGPASYVAKYCAKASRSAALRGVRLFSSSLKPVGWVRHCIRDIQQFIDGRTTAETFEARAGAFGVERSEMEKAKRDPMVRQMVFGVWRGQMVAAQFMRRCAEKAREVGDLIDAALWDRAIASDSGWVTWKKV